MEHTEEFKREGSLEAKTTILQLLDFGHIVTCWENTIKLEKVKGRKKSEISRKKWIDSMKESMSLSLQDLSMTINDGTFWRSQIHRVTINWK